MCVYIYYFCHSRFFSPQYWGFGEKLQKKNRIESMYKRRENRKKEKKLREENRVFYKLGFRSF